MTKELAILISTAAFAISALLWIVAAITAPVIKHSYWDGLPENLVRRQQLAGYLNSAAAICAAVGVAAQAYSNTF